LKVLALEAGLCVALLCLALLLDSSILANLVLACHHWNASNVNAELDIAAGICFISERDFLFERRGEAEDLFHRNHTLCDQLVGADELVREDSDSEEFNAWLVDEGDLIVPAGGLAATLADLALPLLCAQCEDTVRVHRCEEVDIVREVRTKWSDCNVSSRSHFLFF